MIELIVVLVLIAGVIALSLFLSNKRKTNLKAAANRYGWDYASENEFETGRKSMNNFQLGNKGGSKKCRHVLTAKTEDKSFIMLDYQFRSSETFIARGTYVKSSIDEQTILILEISNWNLPQFMLLPKMRSGRKRPDEGLVFENEPTFSEKYILDGVDRETISALFTTEVIKYFSENNGWYIEGNNQQLLICKEGELQPTDKLHLLLEKGLEIKRVLLPDR